MIEGVCPRCGNRYYGWSLLQPQHQICSTCGVGLLIIEDGKRTIQGYSPFAAKEYNINLPSTNVLDSDSVTGHLKPATWGQFKSGHFKVVS